VAVTVPAVPPNVAVSELVGRTFGVQLAVSSHEPLPPFHEIVAAWAGRIAENARTMVLMAIAWMAALWNLGFMVL
jgi:hypothetical protein